MSGAADRGKVPPSPAAVPKVAVDAADHSRGAAAAIFASMVRDVFEAEPLDAEPPCGATIAAWHLGTTMIGTFAGPPTRFSRDSALIASSGLDQLLVQLYVEGGFVGTAGEVPIRIEAGDLCVFDLADTIETRSSRFANISLLVPRETLRRDVEDASRLGGLVIPGGAAMGAMLADHLRSLVRNIDALRGEEATLAAGATMALVRATLGAAMRAGRSASPAKAHQAAPLRRAFDYIDAHIDDPALDVDSIAQALGCSRAALFRLFSAQGGVETYVRRRRLGGAARELADQTRVLRVGEIAGRWGFASDAAFSRAFRQAFGISPRAARQHHLTALLGHFGATGADAAVEERFMAWLRTLRFGNETLRQ